MNLYKKYDTLMKRGMPEHPRLRVSHYDYFEPGNGWVQEPVLMLGERLIEEDDAADLLTMHALRWWLASNDHTEIHARAFRGLDPSERDSVYGKDDYPGQFERHAGGEPYDDGKGVGHNYDTLLDAILAATSHLEK